MSLASFIRHKPPIPYMGLHPPRPYFNLHHLNLKTSYTPILHYMHGILSKIKYPTAIASFCGAALPSFRDTILCIRLAPPLYIHF